MAVSIFRWFGQRRLQGSVKQLSVTEDAEYSSCSRCMRLAGAAARIRVLLPRWRPAAASATIQTI